MQVQNIDEIKDRIVNTLYHYLNIDKITLNEVNDFMLYLSDLIGFSEVVFIIKESDNNTRSLYFNKINYNLDYFEPDNSFSNLFAEIENTESNIIPLNKSTKISELFADNKAIAFQVTNETTDCYLLIKYSNSNYKLILSVINLLKLSYKALIGKSVHTNYIRSDIKLADTIIYKIIDNIDQIVFVSDIETKEIIYANKYAKMVYQDDFSSKKCFQALMQNDSPCKDCLRLNYGGINIKKNIYQSVLNKYFDLSHNQLDLGNRKVVIEIAFDVTDNRNKELELLEKIRRIDIQTQALDMAAIVNIRNEDGKIIYCNNKFEETFGYSIEETEELNNLSLNEEKNNRLHIYNSLRENGMWKGEFLQKRKNGESFWLDTTIISMENEGKKEFVSISFDITEKVKTEEQVRILSRAVHYSPVSIVITDHLGIIQFVNPKFSEITEYTFDEVIGKNPRILKSGYMSQIDYRYLWDTISAGKTWIGYFHNKKKSGELFWEAASISPVYNNNDEITNYIAIKEDVTFKKKIEEALSNSLELLQTTFESINEGVIAFNNTGIYTNINNTFLELWDISEEEIFNKSEFEICEFISSKIINSDEFNTKILEIKTNQKNDLYDRINLINNKIYEITIKPITMQKKNTGRLWSFKDITDKVKNEEKLFYYTHNLEIAKIQLEEQTHKLESSIVELEKAKTTAEAATKVKSEFIANISHEIRTPLNAVLGFAELLKGENSPSKQEDFLNAISSSGKNLLRLINDILDLSKIEAGKLILKYESINIRHVFKEVFEMFYENANRNNTDLRIKIDDNIPHSLFIDEVRLRQILFNLIGNAVKFTEKGYIELRLNADYTDESKDFADIQIEVEDTGIGIKPELQKVVFDAFTQLSAKSSKKYEGTGLGLAITKKLTEMIGGTISLISIEGRGSIFTVNLKGLKVCHSDNSTGTKAFDNAWQDLKIKDLVILAADDIPVNLKLIKGYLVGTKVQVLEAINGVEAVEIVKNNKVDLILMDLKMPELSGYQAAKQIKEDMLYSDIPIIALTAIAYSDSNFENDNHYFDGYLSKPFTKKELFRIIDKYFCYDDLEIDAHPKSSKYQIDDLEIELAKPIINILSDELMIKWEEARKYAIIDKIKDFAYELQILSKNNQLTYLFDYSLKLYNEAKGFDFENLPKTLSQYPKIIDAYTINAEV